MKRTQAILTCLALFWVVPANAFWSASKYKIHQEMTSEALDQSIYPYGAGAFGFSPKAIGLINWYHTVADSNLSGSYQPKEHFDSESFLEGFNLIKARRAFLIKELEAPTPNQGRAWRALGLMLHAIQDFYAHSNWVQLNSDIVNFGAATLPGGPMPSFVRPTNSSSTCDSTGVKLLSVFTGVTTGYYDTIRPAGKCAHGTLALAGSSIGYAVAACAAYGLGTSAPLNGINHDHPCSNDPAWLRLHQKARDLAEKETESFVKSIASELNTAGAVKGFCALLDLDPSGAPCNASSGGSAQQTFVQWTVDNVSFGPYDPCSAVSSSGNRCYIANGIPPTSADISITASIHDDPIGVGGPFERIYLSVYGVPPLTLTNGVERIPIATTTGPTLTYPLSTATENSVASAQSYGNVGFATARVNGSTPITYPAYTILFSESYLARNVGASPGFLTVQYRAVPIVAAPVTDSMGLFGVPVAKMYASGSFDFFVADTTLNGTNNIGSHRVRGTYLIDAGNCISRDSVSMTCAIGNGGY